MHLSKRDERAVAGVLLQLAAERREGAMIQATKARERGNADRNGREAAGPGS